MGLDTNKKFLVPLGFVLVSTIWGSTWLAIKINLEYLPPFLSAGVRFLVASLVLLAIVLFRILRIPFHREALKTYFAIGVLSFAIPFALVYW